MRLVACGVLLAGCNSIFGLSDNAKLADPDGPVFPDGELETFKLRYQLADTTLVAPATTNEPKELELIGMADVTAVKIGTLDGELFDAPYDAATGNVGIPLANITGAAWRVRYTRGGVEREVQWQPEVTKAKLVEPLLGRQAAPVPPNDSGYNIQPTGAGTPPVGAYKKARVYTTGAFLDLRPGASPSTTTIPVPSTVAFGAIGAPDGSLGDAGVLVDYKTVTGCTGVSAGYGHFVVPGLTAGTKTPVAPAWKVIGAATQAFSLQNFGVAGAVRMTSALGTRMSGSAPVSALEYGVTASTSLPGIVIERPVDFSPVTDFATSNVRIPGPHMLVLASCNLNIGTVSVLEPTELEKFPRVTHGLFADRRTVHNTELVSSVISVAKAAANSSIVDLGTPLAIDPITLTAVDGTVISLSGDADDVALPAVSQPFALSFKLELETGFTSRFDQVEVAIHQLAGGTPVVKRVFVSTRTALTPDRVIATPIPIDLAGLPSGNYAMSIRTIAGTPNVAQGDFETIASPYGAATIFTRSFVIP